MDRNELVANASSLIFIQINGEKTARVESALSTTVAEFRASLLSQDVQLPPNAQFLDAHGYPVSVINEKSSIIRDLVVSTTDGEIIKLRINERTTNVDTKQSTMTTVKRLILIMAALCFAYYIDVIFPPRDIDVPYANTTSYMTKKILNIINGTEMLVNTKGGLEKVKLTGSEHYFVSIYDDWVKNETIYKADYAWYNNMLSTWGNCPGRFDEKVMHSDNIIKDTPESIQEFIKDEFEDWPQKLRVKLNIQNRLKSAANDDGDEFNLGTNGKISSNMYLAAWRREDNNTVHIHTYATIFERTAGHGCRFNPEYWTGKKDKITNAKKYFLLTKVKTNPVYKNFLISIPQA